VPPSVEAKQVLRLLYRARRLAGLERQELRLLLFILSGMPAPGRPRRWRPSALHRALGLSAAALNRAAAGLERRGWLRITRTPRTWVVEVKTPGGKR